MPAECWLPFSHWNLRFNPFGELTPSERAEVAVFDAQPYVAALRSGRVAVQFIGDCGRGKTTRLLALRQALGGSGVGHLYVPPLAAAVPRWWLRLWHLRGEMLMIDEAQRVPWPVRIRIFSRGVPLVLATHRDLSGSLRRAGYRVITVAVGAGNDAQHVQQVANARLRAARLHPGEVPQLSFAEAERLVRRFGDDLRAIEYFLYHQVQQQAGRNGQMRFVD